MNFRIIDYYGKYFIRFFDKYDDSPKPVNPLPQPNISLFDDQGDGYIRYTGDPDVDIEDEPQKLEELALVAGLSLEEGEKVARKHAERNCNDIKTMEFYLSWVGVLVCDDTRVVTYSYEWKNKLLEGEIYRFSNEVSIEINPKTKEMVKFEVEHPSGYDIAVREKDLPEIDSDTAFSIAYRKFLGDRQAIVETIEKDFNIKGEERLFKPELCLYAINKKTPKFFWHVMFSFDTCRRKHERDDTLSITVRVDADSGDAWYDEIYSGHFCDELPIKVERCPYECLDGDMKSILEKLPPPTKPKPKWEPPIEVPEDE